MAVLGPKSAVVALAFITAEATSVFAQDASRQGERDRIEIAGRTVHCEGIRTRLDRQLPNLGMAVPEARLLFVNPARLKAYSPTVQLFVFHHECGHHRVGDSELEADCWAVGEGVRAGWLERNGLAQVCRSFDNAPETDTHPSGKRRCANLDRCYAAAETETIAARRREQTGATRIARQPAEQPKQAAITWPKLVSGPQRVELIEASGLARRQAEQSRPAAVTLPKLVSGPQLMWSGRR